MSYGRMAPGDLDDTIGDAPRSAKEVFDSIVKSEEFKTIVDNAVAYAKSRPQEGYGVVFSQSVREAIVRQMRGQKADDETGDG